MVLHHGYRSKTRRVFRKNVRDHGLKGLSRFLVDFKVGDKVDIIIDSATQKRGMPHKRFQGKTATVVGKRGRCFEIIVKDMKKAKLLIVGREHLRMNKYHLLLREAEQVAEKENTTEKKE
jgi:large subunit ribosomal protein L21e